MKNAEGLKLGFVDIVIFEDKSIRGGLLITDGDTYPYEFRVTSPIQATSMLRILYGGSFQEYVYTKLIGLPLLESVKEKPDLILVKTKHMLSIRPSVGFPIVLIRRPDSSGQVSASDLSISVHEDFQSEESWASTAIFNLAQRRDMLEPFERLRLAIQETDKYHPEEKR